MAQDVVWKVVGGADKGGIIVREGRAIASTQLLDRLSTGATVAELELAAERLRYRRLTGTGPDEGWISISLKEKVLAHRVAPGVAASVAPASSRLRTIASKADGGAAGDAGKGKLQVATFAMGWFWGPQAQFDKVPGVVSTVVGYTGGTRANPTYESVCAGDGHTEALQVEFDPSKISYDDLLGQFVAGHRPGGGKAQYKSAIWYHNEEQKQAAEEFLKARNQQSRVDLDPAKTWNDAEDYHQKYQQ